MRVCVIGTGYVGLVSSAIFAHLGHQVIGLDIDKEKIKQLNRGKTPIYEPGLEELLNKYLDKRIVFTTDYQKAIESAEVIFICVGTPPKKDGSYDSKFVYSATESIAKHLTGYSVVVIKSTVPPSTTNEVKKILAKNTNIKVDVASTPEFLREGSAINDALHPARVVLGVETKKSEKILKKLHKKLKGEVVVTTPQSAQLTKYAANAMLATRISFMNSMAIIADKVGANINDISKGLGLDPRIGSSFLDAGLGYGGSCFPKDTWALISYAKTLGYDFDFLKQVDQVNQDQIGYFIDKIKKTFKGKIKGKTLTVLGLAFKPNTDDLREARSLEVIKQLNRLGVVVHTYDPIAMPAAKGILKGARFFDDPYKALADSDGLILVTEWQEFKDLNFRKVKRLMNQLNIFDGRNALDANRLKKLKFNYIGIGQS